MINKNDNQVSKSLEIYFLVFYCFYNNKKLFFVNIIILFDRDYFPREINNGIYSIIISSL